MRLFYLPSPGWGGEENRKKKAKLVGQDKDSLTEQQRKWTVTTAILMRTGKRTEQLNFLATRRPARSQVKTNSPPPGQLPHWDPSMTSLGTDYLICLASWVSQPGCVASWLLVKINSIPAKLRTLCFTVFTSMLRTHLDLTWMEYRCR